MASAYREAASMMGKVEARRSSLRNAAYATSEPQRNLALVSAAVQNRAALEGAVRAVGVADVILGKAPGQRRNVGLLATFDAVAGKGLPRGAGGKLVRCLREHGERLGAEYRRLGGEGRSLEPRRRRHARWNPLRGPVDSTIEMRPDPHLPSVFSSAELDGEHELVTTGRVVLQDKPSCIPAHVLIAEAPRPPRGVLDCCAAPGNKTTHAAALLEGTGSVVHALDRDPERYAVLLDRLSLAGATQVRPRLADFLGITPAHFSDVEAILLDPSCSGSGIRDHQPPSSPRLDRLAAFQLAALTKALTEFPNVTRVVYSTCSVHDLENESVVADALRAAGGAFHLATCLPSWPRRGRPHPGLEPAESRALLRVDPDLDDCTGFFVALFVRRDAPLPGRAPPRAPRVEDDRRRPVEAAPAADTRPHSGEAARPTKKQRLRRRLLQKRKLVGAAERRLRRRLG